MANPAPILQVPALRVPDAASVAIQPADVGGSVLHVVSIRHPDGARFDRWFATELEALAHAAEMADRLSLLLLDLREPTE